MATDEKCILTINVLKLMSTENDWKLSSYIWPELAGEYYSYIEKKVFINLSTKWIRFFSAINQEEKKCINLLKNEHRMESLMHLSK